MYPLADQFSLECFHCLISNSGVSDYPLELCLTGLARPQESSSLGGCSCSGATSSSGSGGADCASYYQGRPHCYTIPGACEDGEPSSQIDGAEWSFVACEAPPGPTPSPGTLPPPPGMPAGEMTSAPAATDASGGSACRQSHIADVESSQCTEYWVVDADSIESCASQCLSEPTCAFIQSDVGFHRRCELVRNCDLISVPFSGGTWAIHSRECLGNLTGTMNASDTVLVEDAAGRVSWDASELTTRFAVGVVFGRQRCMCGIDELEETVDQDRCLHAQLEAGPTTIRLVPKVPGSLSAGRIAGTYVAMGRLNGRRR
jgi:hypothetical protein